MRAVSMIAVFVVLVVSACSGEDDEAEVSAVGDWALSELPAFPMSCTDATPVVVAAAPGYPVALHVDEDGTAVATLEDGAIVALAPVEGEALSNGRWRGGGQYLRDGVEWWAGVDFRAADGEGSKGSWRVIRNPGAPDLIDCLSGVSFTRQ